MGELVIDLDIVTVHHNETNAAQAQELHDAIEAVEPEGWRFISVDNSAINRGFAGGCNWGAFHPQATAPYIAFINPDVEVTGPFIRRALGVFNSQPKVVITGCRYGKSDRELAIWGVRDWVCGAAFFVRRSWFTEVGGFHEGYVWSWEETDLVKQAEAGGFIVRSKELGLLHASPSQDSEEDARYKERNFELGRRLYARRWGAAPDRRRRDRAQQLR